MSIIQIFLQKDFKLNLGRSYKDFDSNLLFVLLPQIQSFLLKEYTSKKNLLAALGFTCSKIVFALLYKIITIYVRVTFIKVWHPKFKSLLNRFLGGSSILVTSYGTSIFNTILKICQKLSLIYLGAWKVAKLGLEFEEPIRLVGASGRAGNSRFSPSLLRELSLKGPDVVAKA